MSLDIPILACDRHTDVVGLTPPLLLTVAMQLVVTNDPHPHEYVTFSDFAYPAYALCISCFQSFKIIWIPSRLVLSVPDEGYSRNASSALDWISQFLLLSLYLRQYLC